MNWDKTEQGTTVVKVFSDEQILLSELSDVCFSKQISNDMDRENGAPFLVIYNVTEAEIDELYQMARESTDDLYQQAMRVDHESEFPNW